MSNVRKDLKKLAKRRGWTLTVRKNSHLLLTKDGCRPVHCSMSASGTGTLQAIERDIDRAEGLRPDPYRQATG